MKKLIYAATFLVLAFLVRMDARAATYENFTYEIEDSQITITEYQDDSSTSVTVPESINGYPVTSIGDGVFNLCSSIHTVILPESIVHIGSYAFYKCDNLAAVNLPDRVKSIGSYAFAYCTSLETIKVPDNLEAVRIGTFDYDTSLRSFTGQNSDGTIYTKDGVLFEDTALVYYPCNKDGRSYVIEPGITKIYIGAFLSNNNLTEIIIPSTITYIDSFSFCSLKQIVNLVFCHTDTLPTFGTSAVKGLQDGSTISVKTLTIKDSMDRILGNTQTGCGYANVSEATLKNNLYPSTSLYLVTDKSSATDQKTNETIYLQPEETTELGYSIIPANSTDQVTWSSSNSAIARVSKTSGLVTAVTTGSCEITGTDEHGHSVTVTINVFIPATSIRILDSCSEVTSLNASIKNNYGLVDLEAEVTPYNATGSIKWYSSDSSVVTVKQSSLEQYCDILIKGVGTTTFYAEVINADGTKIKSREVTITISAIDISSQAVSLIESKYEYTGSSITPSVTVGSLVNGTDYTVSYSNNTDVGEACITIHGIGKYTGTITKHFTICRNDSTSGGNEDDDKSLSLSGTSIALSGINYYYTGSSITPKVTVEGLTPGIDYTVSYRNNIKVGTATVIITGMGKYSGSSVKRTFTIKKKIVPAKVTNLKVKAYTTTAITLFWSRADSASKYYIEQYKNNRWTVIKKVTSTTYTVTGLKASTCYKFRVRAYNTTCSTYGNYSSVITATTKPVTIQNFKKSTVSKTTIKLTWSKASSVSGYQIQYSNNKSFKGIKTVYVKAKSTNTTIKKLTRGKIYYIRIRAYKKVGSKTYYGSYKTLKVKTKK